MSAHIIGLVIVHIILIIVALQFWGSWRDVAAASRSSKLLMVAMAVAAGACVSMDRLGEAMLWLAVISYSIHAEVLKARIARSGGAQ